MTNDDLPALASKRPLQFSLGQLLLIVTVACLLLAVVLMGAQMALLGRRLESTQRELQALQPLPVEDVATQFEKAATLGPVTTTVDDVRYSQKEDAYRVAFSWTDAVAKQSWSSDVTLKNDGFGRYFGAIRNGPFIQPLGVSEQFFITVSTPSTFDEKK